jgi:hypothetical protein
MGRNGVVTVAALLEGLTGLLDDGPTRLALAGLVGGIGASAGLAWWASQHYVARPATGWQLTTWERAVEAESRSPEPERESGKEAGGGGGGSR